MVHYMYACGTICIHTLIHILAPLGWGLMCWAGAVSCYMYMCTCMCVELFLNVWFGPSVNFYCCTMGQLSSVWNHAHAIDCLPFCMHFTQKVTQKWMWPIVVVMGWLKHTFVMYHPIIDSLFSFSWILRCSFVTCAVCWTNTCKGVVNS